ncbi:MAG: MFS transporter [Myxococcota bacterium]
MAPSGVYWNGGGVGLAVNRDERRFLLLFLPIVFGFGGRMALSAFDGPLAGRFTQSGYGIGLLLAIGPLVSAVLNPGVGRLSDRTWTRFGRRMPFVLLGVPLSIVILFAIPSAGGFGVLLLLFGVRAVLGSLGGVPLMSLIPDMTSPSWRGRIMSIFLIVGGVGAIVIQASGKAFWEQHFAYVYYLTGALSLFILPPLFFIREPRPEPGELEMARARRGSSVGALLGALTRREPIALFLASAGLRYLSVGIVASYFTLFALTDLGISVGDSALAIAVSGLARLPLAVPSGQLADRMDRRRLLLGTTLATALLHALTGFAVWNLTGLYAVLLVGAIIGSLDMVVSGPLFMDLLPADQRGELTGVNMVLQNVFRAVGALLGGAVFAWTGGYRLCYAAAVLCLVLSALLLTRVRIPSPQPLSGEPTGAIVRPEGILNELRSFDDSIC